MAAIVVAGAGVLYAAPAAAQATRTWVSGVGDDANPCSRTAPCKTFAGAISKTAPHGEINCIDPAGYGAVTITKSIALVCDYVEMGITNPGSPGITINAATTDTVEISGLDLQGINIGTNGINVIQIGTLHVRNSTIRGNTNSQGIQFTPNSGTTANLYLDNVTLAENGEAAITTSGGLRIAPANNATANVFIQNSKIVNNANAGVRVDLSGTTGTKVLLSMTDTVVLNDGVGMLIKATAGTGTINATLTRVNVAQNSSSGIATNGPGVNGRVYASMINANGSASSAASTGVVVANGATLASYGNNSLDGNFNMSGVASDGAFSGMIAPK